MFIMPSRACSNKKKGMPNVQFPYLDGVYICAENVSSVVLQRLKIAIITRSAISFQMLTHHY